MWSIRSGANARIDHTFQRARDARTADLHRPLSMDGLPSGRDDRDVTIATFNLDNADEQTVCRAASSDRLPGDETFLSMMSCGRSGQLHLTNLTIDYKGAGTYEATVPHEATIRSPLDGQPAPHFFLHFILFVG